MESSPFRRKVGSFLPMFLAVILITLPPVFGIRKRRNESRPVLYSETKRNGNGKNGEWKKEGQRKNGKRNGIWNKEALFWIHISSLLFFLFLFFFLFFFLFLLPFSGPFPFSFFLSPFLLLLLLFWSGEAG